MLYSISDAYNVLKQLINYLRKIRQVLTYKLKL